MRAHDWPLSALLMAGPILAAASCSSGGDGAGPWRGQEYTSERVAPVPTDYDVEGHNVSPERDSAMAELTLESGSRVVIWIDTEDYRRVLAQHSSPLSDDSWTEPEEIYTSGDGCLSLGADTDGTIVAVAVACYESDANSSADVPDEGAALVTTNLSQWQVEVAGAFECDDPEVEGGQVSFENTMRTGHVLTWSESDGFEDREE